MDFDAQDHHKKVLNAFIITGNFIIGEIYRISDGIPPDFVDPISSRFNKIIVDFAFFQNKSLLEKYVEKNEEGKLLDETFYEKFSTFLKDFSNTLNAICTFIFDFVEYSDKCIFSQNVLDGRFIELNVLKCEILHLLGIMLLLMENEFPGNVKERIFVALYRSGAEFPSKNFELLISILRKRNENYEACLQQLKVNADFVEHIIGFLKSYTNMEEANFSHSHFSNEKLAAMLYVCLYFKLEVLDSDFAAMRQIVDKYFSDKWIISLHLALRVNLQEKWMRYKAASAALLNTVDPTNVARVAALNAHRIREISIPSGLLSVESSGEYSRLICEYNNHLRWLILHSANSSVSICSKRSVNLSQLVNSSIRISTGDFLVFLTKLANFEYKFRQSCQCLISRKADNSSKLKSRVGIIFEQIIAFLATQTIEESHWNDKLRQWLTSIKECVANLNMNDPSSSQVLEHLRTKIQEVGDLYTDDHIILRQYLLIIASELGRLQSVCLIDEIFLERLTQRTDSIYLYRFLSEQLAAFETLLKGDALAVKFVVLKLSVSVANLVAPVGNIQKRQLLSTFYHKKLEAQLKIIIQVIPRAIFAGMDELKGLFPTVKVIQIPKTKIKEFADLNRRRALAKKTCEVMRLSLGISEMCIKKLGNVEIRPQELLFEGLRQELDVKLRVILNVSSTNILKTLNAQTQQMTAFRTAMLFVCEYIGINGAAMWQDCVRKVVNAAISEAQTHRLKVNELISPLPPPSGKHAAAMMVRKHVIESVLEQFLVMTNPRNTNYHMTRDEWWSNSRKLDFTIAVFTVVENWLPGTALYGFRRIFVQAVFDLLKLLRRDVEKTAAAVIPILPLQFNQKFIDSLLTSTKFIEYHKRLLVILSKIGQLKIVEENIFYVMDEQMKTRMESVVNSSKNYLRILAVYSKKNSQKTSTNLHIEIPCMLYSYFENFNPRSLPLEEKIRNPRKISVIFFASLVAYFSINVISSKKSEHYDTFAVFYGLSKALSVFRIRKEFDVLCFLFLNDAKVLGILKQFPCMSILLRTSMIPNALRN